ncbi:MAG: hypothetical protein F6K39_20545 [Okeania sp. SIO3B3]|nr:hypothetical protein [Okeania sp. SIO3B3]
MLEFWVVLEIIAFISYQLSAAINGLVEVKLFGNVQLDKSRLGRTK